ncbi:DUF1697 domain-containing protein [Neotamlana laminarinivorans]|uniref:DUF1697 domain-containing protein n=1 Tax=Neotamlana laminarinivorans TaxID=2883124 RepID=A0A9X1I2N9_9FLAO|nr:DUF1697 domain-containing protein [Tamlana laminarinivorans]MCB4799127.1 DUF1697 domain-containing protein [Tamlana laminarinivorans]
MKTFIALLRGINVSGKNKIPMADLRALLIESGLQNVQTYIQSGNVVFESSEENNNILETLINQAIAKKFKFNVPILVLTPKELSVIFNNSPFPQEQKENSYFAFLFQAPNNSLIEEVSELNYPNESFKITPNCVYFYSSVGYGRAKCNNNFFERKLQVTATARNYKTTLKLMYLSN